MSKIVTFFKDLLAPKKCYGCQKQGHFLCPDCERNIQKHIPSCYVCKQKTDNFNTHQHCQDVFYLDQVILYTRYQQKSISGLIKNGKFYHKKDIWEEVARYYSKILRENIPGTLHDYVLVPVPMYRWKKYFRGYNQSELLVKHISKQIGVRSEYNLIKKIKSTSQQSHLSKKQRLKNLEGSFEVNIKLIDKYKNNTIIIIDDVISTATTCNIIAQLLRQNDIKKVVGCVFASD